MREFHALTNHDMRTVYGRAFAEVGAMKPKEFHVESVWANCFKFRPTHGGKDLYVNPSFMSDGVQVKFEVDRARGGTDSGFVKAGTTNTHKKATVDVRTRRPISVGPGHVTLISAVRFHDPNQPNTRPVGIRTSKRGLARERRLHATSESEYVGKNTCTYVTGCGQTRAEMASKKWVMDTHQWRRKDFVEPTKFDPGSAFHKLVRLTSLENAAWDHVWSEVSKLRYRRLTFWLFKKSQRART
jgi:hypothetical protein